MAAPAFWQLPRDRDGKKVATHTVTRGTDVVHLQNTIIVDPVTDKPLGTIEAPIYVQYADSPLSAPGVTVVGTVPLPTGAATEATLAQIASGLVGGTFGYNVTDRATRLLGKVSAEDGALFSLGAVTDPEAATGSGTAIALLKNARTHLGGIRSHLGTALDVPLSQVVGRLPAGGTASEATLVAAHTQLVAAVGRLDALVARLTDGTQRARVTDGTSDAAVLADTPAATTPALAVRLPAGQAITAHQGVPTGLLNAWAAKLTTDGSTVAGSVTSPLYVEPAGTRYQNVRNDTANALWMRAPMFDPLPVRLTDGSEWYDLPHRGQFPGLLVGGRFAVDSTGTADVTDRAARQLGHVTATVDQLPEAPPAKAPSGSGTAIVTASTTKVALLTADPARREVIITNRSLGELELYFDEAPDWGVALASGERMQLAFAGRVDGRWSVVDGHARVLEVR